MAVTVKRITLWRADVDNQPGVLARALEPLAQAGADLRLVMGFRLPHTPERAAIELYPVSGKRATAAAAQAGLAESRDIPCLLVEGDNRPGLGAAMARGLADARINIAQARLYTLYTAWLMDKEGNKAARTEISGIKVAVPKMALEIVDHKRR